MKPLPVTELAQLVGMDWRTVAARIAEAALQPCGDKKGRKLYDSAAALRVVLLPKGRSLESMTPADRLSHRRAELVELELAERRRELLPAGEVRVALERRLGAFRARSLAIPSKAAPLIAPPGKVQQAEEVLTAHIHEALAELAGDGVGGAG